MLRYSCLCWTFIFSRLVMCIGKPMHNGPMNNTIPPMDCSFYVKPGEVRINVSEDLSISMEPVVACSHLSLETFNSYTLEAHLVKNRTYLEKKRSSPVVFSFTSPTLAYKEPATPLPFPTPDCAVDVLQSSGEACVLRPLKEHVDYWLFSFFDAKCSTAQTVIIYHDNIVSSAHGVTHDITCDCKAIQFAFQNEELKSIISIAGYCQNIKKKMRECQSLQLFEGAIRNITIEGPLNPADFSMINAKVTPYTDDQKSFFISLPSKDSTMMQVTSVCRAVADDVTVEVHQEVLSQVKNSSGGRLNIGAFWFLDDTLFPVEQANVSLLSPRVVALDLGQEVSSLKKPIQLTFYVQNTALTQNTSSSPQCVFWDVTSGNTAYWNPSGCKTEVGEGNVSCVCNHLSFFAVLMTPVGVVSPLTAAEVFSLMVLSRVGCSVSLTFLLLTLLTHAFYKKGPSENSLWIHLHVCVALLLLNLTFLINDFLTSLRVPAVCVAMAALTHYALLGTLTWFAIEGLHLYLLFIRVFNIHMRRYLLKLGLLGWGLPAVPVAVSVGLGQYGEHTIESQEGGTTAICWVRGEKPVLMILTYCYFLLGLLFNISMYSVVLHQVLKARRRSAAPQDRGLRWGMVLSLLGLSWLLGVSWAIMSMSPVAPLQKITFYMFCTINGLHGFFLFLRYCSLLRKEKNATSITPPTLTGPHTSKTN